MKKPLAVFFIIAISLAASAAASAQQRPARPAAQQEQNRIQQAISDIYVNQFQNEVGLTEDQFLKVGPAIRRFIQMRFNAANQKQNFEQRLNQLLAQSDPSEQEVLELSDQKARLERNVANSESNLLTGIGPDLSPRQRTLVLRFNDQFFSQRLPQLLERVRAGAAPRGPNQNKNKTPANPADAFRDRN